MLHFDFDADKEKWIGGKMAEIFLSYSRKDAESAKQVRDALVQTGYSVFWDIDTPVGENWNSWIRRHLDDASCVIVLWSKASVNSPNVHHEAWIARESGKLVPATLDSVSPLELPMGFFTIQAATLSNWNGRKDSNEFNALLNAVNIRLSKNTEKIQHIDSLDISLLETLCEQGDSAAQRALGIAFLVGSSVSQDIDRAVDLLKKAAYSNEPEAQRIYGFFLINGFRDVVCKNVKEGVRLLRLAANTGLPEACVDLARLICVGEDADRDDNESFRLAAIAAEAGNVNGIVLLSKHYYHGRGTEKNFQKVVDLLRIACKEGSAEAHSCLGILYKEGNGLPRDFGAAYIEFLVAADLGYANAYVELAVMFEEGLVGHGPDPQRALKLYEKAMSAGLSNELCNHEFHSAPSGTRSSNITWKLCSAGFQ